MRVRFPFQNWAWYFLCSVALTIPLVFGARHPLILGLYVLVLLAGCGGYLLFSASDERTPRLSFFSATPIILIGYLFLQSVPLPLDWLELVTPARAERLAMVNQLAGTEIRFAAISEKGSGSFQVAVSLLAVLLYYYSLLKALSCRRNRMLLLCYYLIGVGVFEAVYGLVQFVNPQIGILWLKLTGGRAAHGTIIYKNQYASLLNMIWPLAVACSALYFMNTTKTAGGQGRKSRVKRTMEAFSTTRVQVPFFLFATLLMVLAVLFSLSRGGILAMGRVGLLLMAFMPVTRKAKLIFAGIVCALVLGYGGMLGLETITSRFNSIGESGTTRLDFYLSSLPMLWAHWLTGTGMESYVMLSPVYLKGFPANLLVDRVHNEYLELIIELGVPFGMLLFCWLVGGVGRLTKAMAGQRKAVVGKDQVVIGTAALCGLAGFLVHGIVDFGWRLPANLVYAATLLALTVSSLHQQEKRGESASSV